MALRQLLDDVKAWIEYKAYTPDEIAVRLHHRLVHIHPFPNGNGRHSRLMADLLIMQLGGERFTWGSANLQDAGDVRSATLNRLRRRIVTTSGRCSPSHVHSPRPPPASSQTPFGPRKPRLRRGKITISPCL